MSVVNTSDDGSVIIINGCDGKKSSYKDYLQCQCKQCRPKPCPPSPRPCPPKPCPPIPPPPKPCPPPVKKCCDPHPCDSCERGICPPDTIVKNSSFIDTAIFVLALDDNLDSDPVHIGAAGLQGFRDYLHYNEQQIRDYRDQAILWFKNRFGIDFSGAEYNPVTGESFIPGLLMTPITMTGNGKYRVMSSTTPLIKTCRKHRPGVRLVEFVVLFLEDTLVRGTYAQNAPDGVILERQGSSLAFGTYLICSEGQTFRVDMKSYYVNTAVPSQGNLIPLVERFLLYSDDFGNGWGTLDIVSPAAPVNGKYPWHIRNQWNFPGSAVYPELNNWNQ